MIGSYPHTYRQEVGRKLIHLSSLWMPVAIYTLGAASIPYLAIALLVVIIYEYARRLPAWADKSIVSNITCLLRPHERHRWRLTGAFFVLVSAILCACLFTDLISLTALCIMIVGDTAAALVGRKWGRLAILNKTAEGTAAFIFSAIIAVLTIGFLTAASDHFYPIALCAVVIGAVAELVSDRLRLDDNLSVALAVGAFMQAFYHY